MASAYVSRSSVSRFPALRDREAELAGDVTNLLLLVARHPVLVAKIPLALVIGHIDFST